MMTPPFSASTRKAAAALGDPLADRLAAATQDLLAACDADRRLVWTNPAWEQLLGWTADELARDSYHRLVHPDDLERAQEHERGGESELRLRARDGSHRWILLSYSPADELTFLCGKDITARKLAEESQRAAEERFRAVTGSTRDGIVSADVNGRIIFWNAGAEAIFGFKPEEAVGQSMDIIIPERLRGRHWDRYHEVMATGTSRYGHGDLLAVPATTKDGRTISIEFTIQMLKGPGGEILGPVATIRDVTKRFQREKEMARRLKELEAKAHSPL
jgi:PAS domain S-box-containing protein